MDTSKNHQALFNLRRYAPHAMAVHIAFEKSADSMLKKLVRIIAGPYVHTEIIITQSQPTTVHTAYSAYMADTFARTFQKDFWFEDQCHDFLHIPVSADELQRICKTCEACVETKIPYNTRDMVLSQLPLRNPEEHDLFHSSTLFCSQAVILILRTSLDEMHSLQPYLSSVNSRTITPSQLYDLLKPECPPRCANQVLLR
jgi:hypothetical protein